MESTVNTAQQSLMILLAPDLSNTYDLPRLELNHSCILGDANLSIMISPYNDP